VRKALVLSAAVAAAYATSALTPAYSETFPWREPVVPAAAAATAGLGGQVDTAEAFIVTLPRLQQKTYSYGAQREQQMDAYWRAPLKGTQPAIVLLHGGYWLQGDKSSWRDVARRLTGRGYAVFAPDYRLSGVAPWPAQRDDAEAALAFVKRHAGHFKVDTSRIVVLGSSAGGQLATMLGTYGSGEQRVRGVVALSPVNSPYLGYVDGGAATASSASAKLRRAVKQLIGCTPEAGDLTCWHRMEDVAPATYASADDAPVLIMHSADEFVPAAHSTGLVSTLRGLGVQATMQVVPGAVHGAGILGNATAWRTVVSWIDSVAKTKA
jgi:acetyl esterase/lipase